MVRAESSRRHVPGTPNTREATRTCSTPEHALPPIRGGGATTSHAQRVRDGGTFPA